MYISYNLVNRSLSSLAAVHPFFGFSYLIFRKAKLPVGNPIRINFSSLSTSFLTEYYQPLKGYRYYQPFSTSNQSARWVSERYGSTTLQRITKDTFGDIFEHPTEREWAWHEDYLRRLKSHLGEHRLPAFELACWILRDQDFSSTSTAEDICDFFFDHFSIPAEDRAELFVVPRLSQEEELPLADSPLTEHDLLNLLGWPPDYDPGEGATVSLLQLENVGPADFFTYQPADRLNIITGDNGLGKTFLLDVIWWSLSGSWIDDEPVTPAIRENRHAEIGYQLSSGDRILPDRSFEYNYKSASWVDRDDGQISSDPEGFALYARSDGSFAVWDPVKRIEHGALSAGRGSSSLSLTQDELWNGVSDKKGRWLCNGLIDDWVTWQTSSRYQNRFVMLESVLDLLSKDAGHELVPGEPVRVAGNTKEIPTLRMPYGDTPITVASAGFRRIASLVYLLVWAWSEHVEESKIRQQTSQNRVVLLIDELESHLHPRWQRVILPAILQAMEHLPGDFSVQVHIGTHSPLVLASIESVFDEGTDDLHHLYWDGQTVQLKELPFVKRGTSDYWLLSEVFGLDYPGSSDRANVIERAKELQLKDNIDPSAVAQVHAELASVLSGNDSFWPRWRTFALKHGVDL
jgi:hypothetical protein